jgi:integrase
MPSTVDRRRGQGSGSITWLDADKTRARLRVFVGTVNGRPRQVSRTVTVSGQREANHRLDELKAEVVAGYHQGSESTLKRLLEEYVAEMPRLRRSPRTIEEARRFVNNVLPPELGQIQIGVLTVRDLEKFYESVDPFGKRTGTVQRYHAVISAALNRAVKWGYLELNPATRASFAKPEEKDIEIPTVQVVTQFVGAAMTDNLIYGTLIRLAVFTALRRGELCALRWADIGPDAIRARHSIYRASGVTGEKTTKSGKGRTVAIAPGPALVLEQWRRTCEASAAAVGGLTRDAFVFSSFPDGSRPLNPDTVSSYVSRLAKALDVKIHFHSLRHFAITELLAGGVAPNDVAKLAGHADPAFTLRRYGHATDERQARAAAILADVMPELPMNAAP